MYTLFVLLHLLGAVFLILVVLLQSGKAGDLASAFGGAGSQTAFGTRSAADFLTRATYGAAILFIVTSLGLSILSTQGVTSVMEDAPVAAEPAAPVPSTPGETTPQTDPATPLAGEQGGDAATPAQLATTGQEKPPGEPPDQSSPGQ